MSIRLFNWDRQGKYFDGSAAVKAGFRARLDRSGSPVVASAVINILNFLNDCSLQWRVQSEM
jgi:hypothetical protein